MEYVLGLLTAVVFFVVIGTVYYIGYKRGNKSPTVTKDDEESRKQQNIHKEFQSLMNYDLDKALQRKKV